MSARECSPEICGSDTSDELITCWKRWKGGIDCTVTQRLWLSGELREETDRFARVLSAQGVRAGECVVLALANTAAFPVALMALLQLGCNPVLQYAGTTLRELDRTASALGIKWWIHDFVESTSRIDIADASVCAYTEVCGMSLKLSTFSGVPRESSSLRDLHGVVLHPTSGTYGLARFCYRNQRVAVAEGENYVSRVTIHGEARVRVTTPLSHAYAYGFGLVASLLCDNTLVLDAEFNPKRVLNHEQQHPSTILALVPPMVKSLTQVSHGRDRPTMARHVFFAGGPCSADVKREFESTLGVQLYAIYGTTETGAISTTYHDDSSVDGVGIPLRNVDVCIAEGAEYASLSSGVHEILVRSSSMMQGYVGQPSISEDTYWATGDLGLLDTWGAIHITGRIKDIINLGGMKVDPAEVEIVLRAHPAVVDAVVYPGLRSEGVEYVQAAIQASDSRVDAHVLRHHCFAELDVFKVPSVFHFVETLPRTPSGKCMKIHCPGFPSEYVVR
ncbi:MAG: fatty-acyl-CoA synthase [Candidatus Hydrogenedentota bacterium]